MAASEGGAKASAQALDSLTSSAGADAVDPRQHLHSPADQSAAHGFLSKFFPSTNVLDELENRFHMGNYVIDRRSGARSWEAMSVYVRLGMHLLYYGRAQEFALHSSTVEDLLRAQSEKMGKQYDDPASVAHIQPFIEGFGLQGSLAEMVKPDPRAYATFNDFFAREIREDARPVDEPGSRLVTSSPADCRLTAFATVDLATEYWIKGRGFTLAKLLGSAQLAQEFEGGSIVIARLAPQDYHRWHAPVDGQVEAVAAIPGTYYTVNPQAINEPGVVDVFADNKRSVMTVRRSTGSRVAIVAVGAMLVGSIKYAHGMETPGTAMRRGQCLGAFYYGGSTVIVLYQRGDVSLDADLVANSAEKHCETLMRVGWRTGESRRR